jgi:hypothetical protein
MTDMTMVVVDDVYCWQTPRPGGRPDEFDHHRAFRGETITVTAEEVDRTKRYGSLAPPSVAVQAIAEADTVSVTPASDAELAEYDATQLAAYLTQMPDEARRVYTLEQARRRPRVTVLRATGLLEVDEDADAAADGLAAETTPGTDPAGA